MEQPNITFELTEPWKKWESIDVNNTADVIKMMYDADVEHANHATAWKIYKHLLLQIAGAQVMFAECDEKMKDVKKQRTTQSNWRSIAARTLQTNIDKETAIAKNANNELAKATVKYAAKYPTATTNFENVEEDRQSDAIPFRKLRGEIRAYMKTLSKAETAMTEMETRKTEKIFTEQEQKQAEDKERQILGQNGPNDARDEEQWKKVLQTVLRTVLQAETNATAQTEWEMICKKRMKNTVKNGMTELQLAESLQRESRLFEWGLKLYNETEEGRAAHKHKIGFLAWQVFLNNCLNTDRWGHLVETNATNGGNVIESNYYAAAAG
jgi:hypothetical protein